MKPYILSMLFGFLSLFTQLNGCNPANLAIGDTNDPTASSLNGEAITVVIHTPEMYPLEEAYITINGIHVLLSDAEKYLGGFDLDTFMTPPAKAKAAGLKYYGLYSHNGIGYFDLNGAQISGPVADLSDMIATMTNAGNVGKEIGLAATSMLSFVEQSGWDARVAVLTSEFDPAVDQLPWAADDLTAQAAAQQTAAQPTPVATLSPIGQQLVAASQSAVPAVPAPWEGLDLTGDPFSPLDYESPAQAARRLGTQGYSAPCLRLYFEAAVEWDWEPNGDGNPEHWDHWRTDVQIPLPALCQN